MRITMQLEKRSNTCTYERSSKDTASLLSQRTRPVMIVEAVEADVAKSAKEAGEMIDDEAHHQVTSVTNATKQDIGKQTTYSHHHIIIISRGERWRKLLRALHKRKRQNTITGAQLVQRLFNTLQTFTFFWSEFGIRKKKRKSKMVSRLHVTL
jgi:hypothetical protein